MSKHVSLIYDRTKFMTAVTQWVLLVEQVQLTLWEHSSSPSGFRGVRVARSLVFHAVFCTWLFVLFLFAIVLSVFLLCTAVITPLASSNISSYKQQNHIDKRWRYDIARDDCRCTHVIRIMHTKHLRSLYLESGKTSV